MSAPDRSERKNAGFFSVALMRGPAYLLSHQQAAREALTIEDERSTHIWAEREGRIVATLRATPSPYELSFYTPPTMLEAYSLQGYLEFSRLTAAPDEDLGAISRALIASACIVGIEAGLKGVVAMCKAPQRRLFERLGLLRIP